MNHRNFLQHYRKEKKVTQRKLAAELRDGVTDTIISQWENGVSDPPEDTKQKLAIILNVEKEKLFPKTKNRETNV